LLKLIGFIAYSEQFQWNERVFKKFGILPFFYACVIFDMCAKRSTWFDIWSAGVSIWIDSSKDVQLGKFNVCHLGFFEWSKTPNFSEVHSRPIDLAKFSYKESIFKPWSLKICHWLTVIWSSYCGDITVPTIVR